MLVFGGSLGARSINLAALEALRGRRASRAARDAGGATTRSWPRASYRPGYDLREYLDAEEFADALAAADLVVARAGGSVFEIAAHGLPAILVPYPHAAADHQTANARWMADAGAAIVIPDGELTAARLARRGGRCSPTTAACGDGVAPRRAWPGPQCRDGGRR